MNKYTALQQKLISRTPLILIDTATQIKEANLLLVASSLAYTTILSIIPLLAVSFAVFQAFGGMEKLYSLIEPVVISNLAEGTGEEAMLAIRSFISNIRVKTLGAGGLLALIFTCISMLSSAEKAINRVWKSEITRPIFQRIAIYWFFITLGPIAFSVVFAAVSSQEIQIIRLLPSGTGAWILSVLILSAVYKWTPNRHVHWISACAPAFITSLLLMTARLGYALYTQKIVSYNKIYGSLGAVPIFLVWIYLVWTIILSGAAMGVAVQKKMELK